MWAKLDDDIVELLGVTIDNNLRFVKKQTGS